MLVVGIQNGDSRHRASHEDRFVAAAKAQAERGRTRLLEDGYQGMLE